MNGYSSTYFEVAVEVAVGGEVEIEESIDDTAKQSNEKAKAKGNCQWPSIEDVSEKVIELFREGVFSGIVIDIGVGVSYPSICKCKELMKRVSV